MKYSQSFTIRFSSTLAVFAFVIGFSTASFADSMYGVLMVVKGSVKIQTSEKKISDAKTGAKVVEGDTVTTGPESRTKIVMSDRNVINVNPETSLVISKYENDASSGKKNVELNLLKGKVRNNVEQTYDGEKNKFLIKTPTAVAGVRGTQFQASYDVKTQMTSVVTFKGSVTLATTDAKGVVVGAPVVIKKGETSNAAPDKAPETPKSVPKEELKKIDGDSTAGNGGDKKRDVASEGPGNSPSKGSSDSGSPVAGGSMVDARDLDPANVKDVKIISGPTPMGTPPPAPSTMATPNPIVKDIVRDGNNKARVIVTPVGP